MHASPILQVWTCRGTSINIIGFHSQIQTHDHLISLYDAYSIAALLSVKNYNANHHYALCFYELNNHDLV